MTGGVVVLAAGASSRFGSDKRAHVLSSGESLLHTTLTKYSITFEQVIAVLRPADDELTAAIAGRYPNCKTVIAARANLGMGHSLAAGVGNAVGWDYVFIALADMPYVLRSTLTHLRRVMESGHNHTIVLPTLEGRAGHPVGFGRAYFAELRALVGDQGARKVVAGHRDQVVEVSVTDAGVLRDVDTPDDAS